MSSIGLAAAVFMSVCTGVAAADNWPQFRGPGAAGVAATDTAVPDEWTSTKNVAWRTALPGRGWSSPVVWNGQVFLTSVVNAGEDVPAQRGLYFGGEQKEAAETEHTWKVFCVDLETGKLLWDKTAHAGAPPAPRHKKNSYASETAATDGKRLYIYFGQVGLFCYSLDGELLWEQKLEPLKTRLGWGTGASPIVYEDRVYVCNDNEQESFLQCLDAATGKEIWKTTRDEKSNWATPFVWKNNQRTEIVTAGSKAVRSYDLQGAELWQIGGMSSITVCTPFAVGDLLYVGSGYVMDKNKPLCAVRPGGSGDLTLGADETSSEAIAWCQKQGAPYNTTPLVYQGHAYSCLDRGVLACFDANTGEERYRERLPNGRAFTASPVGAGGKVYCLNEFGTTFVVAAGPEFKVLHENVLDEEVFLATPALAGNRLLVRGETSLYAIEEGRELTPQP
ncbi:MAG: PQQ-binding-like beta-propeller repeat protein [Pirellulales bacterium]|nr:PQQ-binding-like beta-propeller repeat protein [Pirellulales bacterium]